MPREFRRYEPDQSLLLPPPLRDWLPEDHLAHFVSHRGDGPERVLRTLWGRGFKLLVLLGLAALPSAALSIDCPEGTVEQSRNVGGQWSDHWCERPGEKASASIKHGPFLSEWPNGAPRIAGQYQDGKQEGLWRSWHVSGPKSSERYFENGRPHGQASMFHPNGEVQEQGTFKKGKKHGVWECNYADGSPKERESYVDGNLDGPFRSWRSDGARRDGTYRDGEEVGDWKSWDVDGKETTPDALRTSPSDEDSRRRAYDSTPMPILPAEDPEYE